MLFRSAKGTPSNDVRSSASVTRKASRTFGLPRIEVRTPDVTSWRKIMSGRLDSSRIPPRSRLARAIGRGEKASRFCVMREKWDVRAGCCVAWFGAHLEDTGAHSRVDGLKAEKVRWQSLLAAMGRRYPRLRRREGLARDETCQPERVLSCLILRSLDSGFLFHLSL